MLSETKPIKLVISRALSFKSRIFSSTAFSYKSRSISGDQLLQQGQILSCVGRGIKKTTLSQIVINQFAEAV